MTAPRSAHEARAGAGFRLLRAAVFAAACTALSAAGHLLASAAPVPLWALATGFAAVLAVAVPLAGRPRSLAGIAALLAVGQIALHGLFGAGQQQSGVPGMGMMSGPMGHMPGMGGPNGMSASTALTASTGPAGPGPGTVPGSGAPVGGGTGGVDGLLSEAHTLLMLPSLPMLLGHLLAAFAAGWLLRRGDLAVFRLMALSVQSVADAAPVRALRAVLALVRALRTGGPVIRPAGSRPPRPRADGRLRPGTTILLHSVVRRGPPGPPLRPGCTHAV